MPDLVGRVTAASELGGPRVFFAGCLLSAALTAFTSLPGSGPFAGSVQVLAARIGTNCFRVSLFQTMGRLLSRADRMVLTWGSVAPPLVASGSVFVIVIWMALELFKRYWVLLRIVFSCSGQRSRRLSRAEQKRVRSPSFNARHKSVSY